MTAIYPLRARRDEPHGEHEGVNVLRLLEFLGPVSPELVLVDPELAGRARELMPELPRPRKPRLEAEAAPLLRAFRPPVRPLARSRRLPRLG